MLVITRNVGQTITVDGPCTILIARVDSARRVAVAIDAEKHVNIVRSGAKSGPKPKPAEEPKAA